MSGETAEIDNVHLANSISDCGNQVATPVFIMDGDNRSETPDDVSPLAKDKDLIQTKDGAHLDHDLDQSDTYVPVDNTKEGNASVDDVLAVLSDLIDDVVVSCETHFDLSQNGEELSIAETVPSKDSAIDVSPPWTSACSGQESSGSRDTCLRDDDQRNPSSCDLRLTLQHFERCSSTFQTSTPRVVMDLRYPPLVQVCTLYGNVECGGASSSSSQSNSSYRKPPTAVRGRRRNNLLGTRHTTLAEGLKVNESAVVEESFASQDERTLRADEKTENTPSGGDTNHRTLRSAVRSHQGRNGVQLDVDQRKVPKKRRGSVDSCESDEDNMKVQTVNRTYARMSYSAVSHVTRSEQVTTSDDELELYNPFSSLPEVGERTNRSTGGSAKKSGKSSKSSSFNEPAVVVMESGRKSLAASQKKIKKRRRIGPAWYSRLFLSSPPVYPTQDDRTPKPFTIVKRKIYNDGARNRPLPRRGRLLVTKKIFRVKADEVSEFENIGNERLTLWRMSCDDVEELQSQLVREAEHRRVDHAMPAVMQLSDDQIETAYKRVAESMKTFEIIAADSDDDEDDGLNEDDDEAMEEDNYKDIIDEYRRMIAEREKLEQETQPVQTDYVRSRPKRLAVDYGPSAFAPILLMEGRRLSSDRAKHGASFASTVEKPAEYKYRKSTSSARSSTEEFRKSKRRKSGFKAMDDEDASAEMEVNAEFSNGKGDDVAC